VAGGGIANALCAAPAFVYPPFLDEPIDVGPLD
jgi:hypothetical protein